MDCSPVYRKARKKLSFRRKLEFFFIEQLVKGLFFTKELVNKALLMETLVERALFILILFHSRTRLDVFFIEELEVRVSSISRPHDRLTSSIEELVWRSTSIEAIEEISSFLTELRRHPGMFLHFSKKSSSFFTKVPSEGELFKEYY